MPYFGKCDNINHQKFEIPPRSIRRITINMNFQKLYNEKKMTPDEIVSHFGRNWTVATDITLAIPPAIMAALYRRAKKGAFSNLTLHTMLEMQPFDILRDPDVPGVHRVSWFSGGDFRKLINAGAADVMPCYYRDMPKIFRSMDIDAFILPVSPMDEHGYFSTGLNGSNCPALLESAKRIYLEVNENMPRSINSPSVYIGDIAGLCENNAELPVAKPSVIDEVSRTIGEYIVDEIPNEATLQLGVGAVPDAVGFSLKDKRDLGIHTELFVDSMVELIECGAVTNLKKPYYVGKSVAAFAYGSKRIYDYIDNNPAIKLVPVDLVNDPAIIAQMPKFISVNAALEVDFFGQVCAESIGTMHISGTGGQVDYVRGATSSEGGKSFIAMPSTAKGGEISRIKSMLTEGSIVTTSKNDVDNIVTEYGIARLRGKSLWQRTKELISIAHPKFRDELTFEAKKRNIII